MTVTVLGAGSICVGGAIGGAGVTAANVTTLPSGHTYGCSSSTGAYTLDGTQTLASQTVTATGQKAFTVAGCPAIALSVGQVNVVDTDLSPIAALGGLASCTAGSPAIAVLSAVSPLAAGSTDNLQFVAELPSAVIGSAFAAVVTTGACSGSSLVGGIGLGGGTVSGTFVGATCSASNYIISSLPLAPHGWNCTAIDRTTPADVLSQSPSTGNSTSAAQLNGTTAASDVIGFTCGAF
jgi:hypothetical protein